MMFLLLPIFNRSEYNNLISTTKINGKSYNLIPSLFLMAWSVCLKTQSIIALPGTLHRQNIAK